jgi:hypothetical protein
MRDHERIREIRRRSDQFFDPMTEKLKKSNKAKLLKMARDFSQTERVLKPDRKCVRSREPLISWFCQYVPDFPIGFPQLPDEEGRMPASTVELADLISETAFNDADEWDMWGGGAS